jgi:hypothetical protein
MQRTAILFRWVVILLLLLDGRIVVDEDKGAIIFGIGISLSTLVSRTQIAL